MKQLYFPSGFFWGTSTSSHQVEGHTINDWSVWETSSQRLEALEQNGLLKKYGKENFISGAACDHFHRFAEDFQIAKDLGTNAHRLSIEWSRIEPEKGKFDTTALAHYQQVIQTLRSLEIEPFVTLWHWPLPLWLAQEGGWKSKDIVEYFSRYAEVVAKALGKDVKFWLTLNEPEIYTVNSYFQGIWPPQEKNILSSWKVLRNLIAAHKKAYQVMKEINPSFQIGIAKNNVYFEAIRNKPFRQPGLQGILPSLVRKKMYTFCSLTSLGNKFINKLYKKCADYFWNDFFLKKIQGFQDFIGLNYYFHNRIEGGRIRNENIRVSNLDWELYPEGIYFVLKDLQKYGIPVYITENGLADAKDQNRQWFLQNTLEAVYRAIAEGIDVRGYFHWSFLDNFEWDKGFWPRFGLVEVDFTTQERKIRPSALYYKNICQTNNLDIE